MAAEGLRRDSGPFLRFSMQAREEPLTEVRVLTGRGR